MAKALDGGFIRTPRHALSGSPKDAQLGPAHTQGRRVLGLLAHGSRDCGSGPCQHTGSTGSGLACTQRSSGACLHTGSKCSGACLQTNNTYIGSRGPKTCLHTGSTCTAHKPHVNRVEGFWGSRDSGACLHTNPHVNRVVGLLVHKRKVMKSRNFYRKVLRSRDL